MRNCLSPSLGVGGLRAQRTSPQLSF
jgi:hypothetical protein